MVMRILTREDVLMREAKAYVAEKLDSSWSIEWDRAKNRYGHCIYIDTRRGIYHSITISRPLTELNSDEHFWDTVKHEVAHALVGPGIHHGYEWRVIAKKLGADPTRCYDTAVIEPKPNYIGICPGNHKHTAMRMGKNMKDNKLSCLKCSPRFNHNYIIEWKVNA